MIAESLRVSTARLSVWTYSAPKRGVLPPLCCYPVPVAPGAGGTGQKKSTRGKSKDETNNWRKPTRDGTTFTNRSFPLYSFFGKVEESWLVKWVWQRRGENLESRGWIGWPFTRLIITRKKLPPLLFSYGLQRGVKTPY